jgi:hypothetical protein
MALLRVAMYGTKHPHCAAVAQALQDCADIEFVGGEPFPSQRPRARRLSPECPTAAGFSRSFSMTGQAFASFHTENHLI